MAVFALFFLTLTKDPAQSVDPEPSVAAPAPGKVAVWLTTSDGSQRLARQSDLSWSASNPSAGFNIPVNENIKYQQMIGFGASLVERGIWNADPAVRDEIMRLLFSRTSGIGVSAIRVQMGYPDRMVPPFATYDDTLTNKTDPALTNFSIAGDWQWKLPLIQQAKALNPELSVIGSPWSAPAWMKDSKSLGSGMLLATNYTNYANYFVKWIQAWRTNGIGMNAVTMQNEPLYEPGWYQGMHMEPSNQVAFAQSLGPAFTNAGLSTHIWCYDHNFDRYDYPNTVLSNQAARVWIEGSAFHAYAGTPTNMLFVQAAHPDKSLFFTEQTGGLPSEGFGGSIQWHLNHIFTTAIRCYCRCSLVWELDRSPTDVSGGSRPFVRVSPDGKSYQLYGEYYETGHFSKFVRKGAYRIDSYSSPYADSPTLPMSVAFQNPDGTKVLVVNTPGSAYTIGITNNGRWVSYALPASAVATFIWRDTTNGNGLAATYFDNAYLDTNGVMEKRIDPTVNFDWGTTWGTNSPDPAIGYKTFSARWTGLVQPQFTENHTFYTTSDDGVRLWVNNQLLIDHWTNQAATEWSGSIVLTNGVKYPIVLEYFKSTNSASGLVQLSWSSPSTPKQIIPQSQLYSTNIATVPPPPTGLLAIQGKPVALSWTATPTATTYNLKRSSSISGPYTNLATGLAATSYSDASVTTNGTTYYYAVSGVNATGEGAVSAPVSVTPPGALASGWQQTDIGSVGVAGSAGSGNGVFTVKGSGSDIWNSADAFHYVYVPMTNDGTIVARILTQQDTGGWAKSGVMMRETLTAGSRHANLFFSPDNGVAFQWRPVANSSMQSTNIYGPVLAAWLKLQRMGTNFIGSWSADGLSWQTFVTNGINMATNIYAGLAVCSVNNSVLGTSTFDSVSAPGSVVPLTVAPGSLTPVPGNGRVSLTWNPVAGAAGYILKRALVPLGPFNYVAASANTSFLDENLVNGTTYYYSVAAVNAAGEGTASLPVSVTPQANTLPTPWMNSDIGGVGVDHVVFSPSFAGWIDNQPGGVGWEGDASYAGGIFTVKGSGDDIWGTADSFHFVYQNFSGDGTLIARVRTQQNTHAAAKAGVMIRETLAADSPNVFMLASPANRASLDWRVTEGGSSSSASLAAGSGVAPYWVKLVRSGNTFSGYGSTDGNNWTLTISTNIPMASQVFAGLAVCAHDNNAVSTATFDNFTVGCQPPAAPASLAAVAGFNEVMLTWPPTINASSYNVRRAATSGGTYTNLATLLTTTNFTDATLMPGATGFYVVTAVNDCGTSTNSSEAQATRPLPFVATVQISTTNTLILNWPAGYANCHLLVQTNALGAGLSTNWVDVGAVTNPVVLPLNPQNASVFYRLQAL